MLLGNRLSETSHLLMTLNETELEMVERHVREGNRHIENQRRIVAYLRQAGWPTELAEQLLSNLEDIQTMHLEHLARIA